MNKGYERCALFNVKNNLKIIKKIAQKGLQRRLVFDNIIKHGR